MGLANRILNKAKFFVGKTQSRIKERVNTSGLYSWIHYFFDAKRTRLLDPQKKHVILVNTPVYPNLGDQAIAVAEVCFLRDFFPDYTLVELNDDVVFKKIVQLKKEIGKNDLVFCQGGGNMGVDYFWCEQVRRAMIENFPNNKIVIFPQTIFFDDRHLRTRKELAVSKHIYNAHPDLLLCAREKQSYQTMKELFPQCRVELVPDIVLYLHPSLNVAKEQGTAVVCLRSDRERSLSAEDEKAICCFLEQKGYCIKHTDTVLRGRFSPQDRERIVFEKIREFAAADLVVTDRLHGMIFSFLAKTPCVVFGNYNYKVEGVFEWFKQAQVGSVSFCADVKDLDRAAQSASAGKDDALDEPFAQEFAKLFRYISSISEEENS